MTTVLVTGAAGFVGSAVVRRLVSDGARLWDGTNVDHVVAAVRTRGLLERLEPLARDDGWSVEAVDLEDGERVRRLLARRRPRAIVHTALDASVYTVADRSHTPLEALVESLGRLDDSRIVHAGSAWVLAPGLRLPEQASTNPRTPYARHKLAQDLLLPELACAHGVRWLNLRVFNVLGRYEKRTRLVPSLVERLSRGVPADVSHGTQLRDFSDVDDVARAFLLALSAPDTAWDALYHIGSGHATSARELALMVAGITGGEELIRFGEGTTQDQDIPALTADPSLAARELGWSAEPPLVDSVREVVEWWLERLPAPAAAPQGVEEPIG